MTVPEPAGPGPAPAGTHPALTTVLGDGELELVGRLMQASNATFLSQLKTEHEQSRCDEPPEQRNGYEHAKPLGAKACFALLVLA